MRLPRNGCNVLAAELSVRRFTLLNTDTHDYHRDELAGDIIRSTVPGRRPCPLDRVLPEARFHIRRAVGRVLRDWSIGRAGAPPEGSAQERRRAPTPACERASRRRGRC